MVLLAGCVGGFGGGADAPATDESTANAGTTEPTAETTTGTSANDRQGRLNFYVSDEKNAISQFEHVNVTITRIGLHPVWSETDSGSSDGTADDENGTAESEADDRRDEREGWKTYDVDNRTVDLTELQGDNAARLASFDVSNGSYDKVFVYVSEVNATLKDGPSQHVKLPSGKLQITEQFTVDDGESVDFVFDITIVEVGKSGKYILKPVISESGTDVRIDSVDDSDDRNAAEYEYEEGNTAENTSSKAELNASFADAVERGENATLSITRDGSPVADVTVAVNGERVGTTDETGSFTVSVPRNATKLKVTVAADAEAELEVEFESS
ncbi:DUF4382 domain-containing protein [Halopelagius fulvigenes]|uniref:DUF4382 domain-containing protein n=1 Tax=Halopelagius fulvigenes TaxID=1198324 RepID=A0ABD5U135_9EURY